jgi:hypothetical protein
MIRHRAAPDASTPPVGASDQGPAHRLVLTAADAAGTSTVAADAAHPARRLASGRALAELWRAARMLADLPEDESTGPFPGVNGVRLWVLEIPPDTRPDSQPLHATSTLDIGFVLEGSVTLELADGSSRLLERGDAFVQPGTAHRWVNTTSAPAAIGVVVIGTGQSALPPMEL